MQMRSALAGTSQASRFACRSRSRTPAARLPLARLPLARHSPAARQRCMSGAPPAAYQPSASCSLAPCQLRSCRSPVARQSLASRSCPPSQALARCCRPGVAPSPLSALAVAEMPGSIPGLVTLARCQLCAYLLQVLASGAASHCMLVRSIVLYVVPVLVLPPLPDHGSIRIILLFCSSYP